MILKEYGFYAETHSSNYDDILSPAELAAEYNMDVDNPWDRTTTSQMSAGTIVGHAVDTTVHANLRSALVRSLDLGL